MKIKHWQGYGCVNAKLTERKHNYGSHDCEAKIEVRGNHEYGLDRHNDKYDCFNWLLKRFDKNAAQLDYGCISKIEYDEHWDSEKKEDVAVYTFYYNVAKAF